MSGTTLAQAQAQLTKYREAETKCLRGQSYSIKDRSLQRASLKDIQAGLKYWETVVAGLANDGSMSVSRVLLRDL